eukprot:50585_1
MYNASIIQYLSMFSSIWIIILFQISKSFKLFIFILLSLYCNELTFVHAQSTECLSMSVTVIDGNFAPDIFDGVYRLTNETTFNRPKWTVPQSSNDKTISYFFTSQWIINGLGNNILSYSSTDNLPPINDSNAEWSHSSISGTYHVMMRCILSYSPTLSPSLIPIVSSMGPTNVSTINTYKLPSVNASISPTTCTTSAFNYPVLSPSINPTMLPSQYSTSHIITPTKIPSGYPTISLSFNSYASPTVEPTVLLTSSKHHTLQNPTSNCSITTLTKTPSINPTETQSINPTICTSDPTLQPTSISSMSPFTYPTISTTIQPTKSPTTKPTISINSTSSSTKESMEEFKPV